MIITDQFVLLAFPKTGTTYTTNVLRSIHARRSWLGRLWPQSWQKRDFPRPGYREHRILMPASPPHNKARMSRHGAWSDIPEPDRDKQLVSVTRNPFSRYTSAYLFQTRMRRHLRPVAPLKELRDFYPHYPDLSFREYYEMQHRFKLPSILGGVKPGMELGTHSALFIRFYFRDPESVLRRITPAYIADKAYLEDMAEVKFLHQESLSDEFSAFLRSQGYSELELSLADALKRKNVARRSEKESDLNHFYNESQRQEVLQRDALLFDLFPEYAQPW